MTRFSLGLASLVALVALVPLVPSNRTGAAEPDADVPTRADPKPDAKADAELVKTAEGMFKDLKMVTLDNGLRVYMLPIKGSPIVTTMVAYRVGSGDEE